MDKILIEIKSILTVDLSLKDFPELKSKKKFVQKGLDIVKVKTPRIYRYLSKENAIINLKKYKIIVEHKPEIKPREIKKILKYWIKRIKIKRMFLSFLELLIIPFTAILTPIPGPNFIFYAVFLLFYFHVSGYLSLRKLKVEDLNIEFDEKDIR
jgi:hypothetical protein